MAVLGHSKEVANVVLEPLVISSYNVNGCSTYMYVYGVYNKAKFFRGSFGKSFIDYHYIVQNYHSLRFLLTLKRQFDRFLL